MRACLLGSAVEIERCGWRPRYAAEKRTRPDWSKRNKGEQPCLVCLEVLPKCGGEATAAHWNAAEFPRTVL
jgi:hypothetical protein